MAILEAGFDDATAVLALPEPYCRRLRTSNGMERLNEEVRRREICSTGNKVTDAVFMDCLSTEFHRPLAPVVTPP